MRWKNIRLLLFREARDQLRDRRTLFMIFVLPMLLYPLLGMSMFQVMQFVREQPTRVLLFGADQLPSSPQLVDGQQFAARWFSSPQQVGLLELVPAGDAEGIGEGRTDLGQKAVEQGRFEAMVYFPHDFAQRLEAFQENLRERRASQAEAQGEVLEVPAPELYYNTAKEKSQLAYVRMSQILERWSDEIGRQNLASTNLPATTARPFELAEHDVAEATERDAAIWAKVLPFLLLIWALTGAFYPAIDLCAGEKERGTLETLLTSPAERSEIVWGKLLTVMLFSVATAVLNIASMGLTGTVVLSHLPQFGPPPALAPLWLTIALLPISAMFSALCLALAALARSSKEGQYYLMPLVVLTLPLVILPMAPGVELTLGNSLIPVTGVVLLLRSMLEGNYLQALPFVPPVVAVTMACCLLAIRWAVDQFNSESVMFRESERLDVALWMRHLRRDRRATPTVAMAVCCGVLILILRFFMGSALPNQPQGFVDFARLTLIMQLCVILTPAVLMTVMLTRSPARTLLLRNPPWLAIPAGVLLAVLLHPAANQLNVLVQRLYPVSSELETLLAGMLDDAPSIWSLVLLLAVVPALCEELAFRGFILSGFRHLGHKWRAIVFSALLFGISHGIFQQSIVASLLGLVLGYLAVQTGSLLPGILFHATHNALALLGAKFLPGWAAGHAGLHWALNTEAGAETLYRWPTAALGLALAAPLLWWLHRLPYQKSAEEVLQEAIDHHTPRGGMAAADAEQPAAEPQTVDQG